MLGIRRDVSILLEKGHLQARLYPIIMLQNEAEIVRERRRSDFVLFGTLQKLILDASNTDLKQSDRKELHKVLNEMITDIGNGHYG